MPVRLVTFMENTPHGIRRALTKVRKMSEIRGQYSFIFLLSLNSLALSWIFDGQVVIPVIIFIDPDHLMMKFMSLAPK